MDQFGKMFDAAWPALETKLATRLREALTTGQWGRWDAWSEDPLDAPHLKVRSKSC